MTDLAERRVGVHMTDEATARLRRRYAAEKRFQFYGFAAVAFAAIAVAALLGSILFNGATGFLQGRITLEATVSAELAAPDGKLDPDSLRQGDYIKILRQALHAQFPEATSRPQQRALNAILSGQAEDVLRDKVMADPSLIGKTIKITVPVASDFDMVIKGALKADGGRISEEQGVWLQTLRDRGLVTTSFNVDFLTRGNSRAPEMAGVGGAILGSLLTLFITLIIAFPLGVMTAVYLEEFAPRNKWTDLVEVNINNLAAVPSIVFGLLGLAVFLNVFDLPRSAPVVGGLVLALMSLPVIIIAGRASLRAVPPSIRQAALGMGASKIQMVTHHVLPLAMPGILTGTILSMAHALGETAPLLMIGMVAFIVDIPQGFLDSATVLPVQVFMWADFPERGFVEKTSAAIIVLLAFLVMMNGLAIYFRKKFERKW